VYMRYHNETLMNAYVLCIYNLIFSQPPHISPLVQPLSPLLPAAYGILPLDFFDPTLTEFSHWCNILIYSIYDYDSLLSYLWLFNNTINCVYCWRCKHSVAFVMCVDCRMNVIGCLLLLGRAIRSINDNTAIVIYPAISRWSLF
jgi:hypothetical protein